MKLTAKAISAVRLPGCSSKHLQVKKIKGKSRIKSVWESTKEEAEHQSTPCQPRGLSGTAHQTGSKGSEGGLQHSPSEGTDCQKLLLVLCLGGSQILPGLEEIKIHEIRGKDQPEKTEVKPIT